MAFQETVLRLHVSKYKEKNEGLIEKIKGFAETQGNQLIIIIEAADRLDILHEVFKMAFTSPSNIRYVFETTVSPLRLEHVVRFKRKIKCLKRGFNLLPEQFVTDRLSWICEQEMLTIEKQALSHIWLHTLGNLGSAITMLQRAARSYRPSITLKDVQGVSERSPHVDVKFFDTCLGGDIKAMTRAVMYIYCMKYNISMFVSQLYDEVRIYKSSSVTDEQLDQTCQRLCILDKHLDQFKDDYHLVFLVGITVMGAMCVYSGHRFSRSWDFLLWKLLFITSRDMLPCKQSLLGDGDAPAILPILPSTNLRDEEMGSGENLEIKNPWNSYWDDMYKSRKSQKWTLKYRPKYPAGLKYQGKAVRELADTFLSTKDHILVQGPSGTGKTSAILAIANRYFGPDTGRVLMLHVSKYIHKNRDLMDRISEFAKSRRCGDSHEELIIIEGVHLLPDGHEIFDMVFGSTPEIKGARFVLESTCTPGDSCSVFTYDPEGLCSLCTRFDIQRNSGAKENPKQKVRRLSRRFNPLPTGFVTQYLEMICKEEELTVDRKAMKRLSRYTRGSLGRAIRLLQGAARSYRSTITRNDVNGAIQRAPRVCVKKFFDACRGADIDEMS